MDDLDRQRRKRLLEIAPRFNREVPAEQLLDELSCIRSESTREQIRKRERYESRAHANRLLCSSLVGRRRWYKQLLDGLRAVDCEGIAQLMETDSEGNSLCFDDHTSSSSTFSTGEHRQVSNSPHGNVPRLNQTRCVPATPPPVSEERLVSMDTPVSDFPIGVKNALSILDLPNDGRLSNNWETLAALLDVTWGESNWLERCHSPTTEIINSWYQKHPHLATLGNLLQMLEEMNRLDVISEMRKAVGWEDDCEDRSDSSRNLPAQDRERICRSLEKKHPQYSNNLFGGERTDFHVGESRTTRSLPLDVKDQHLKMEKLQIESASVGCSSKDSQQLSKKMNNQFLDPPGAAAMPPPFLDKSEKKWMNNQDFPQRRVAGLSREIDEAAPSKDRLHPEYDLLNEGLHQVKGQNLECTENAKQDVPKNMNDPQLPATDNSLPYDWSENGERTESRGEGDGLKENRNNQNRQTECKHEILNDLPGRNGVGTAKQDLEKPWQYRSPEEMMKMKVEGRKEMVHNRPHTAESGTTSEITHRGKISVPERGYLAEDGPNDLKTKNPECHPDERTLNPNMMTADSRRGTESRNYTVSQKKQMYRKKQVLKELNLPSQMAGTPAQNSFGNVPDQYDISDSPPRTLTSDESFNVSSSEILESLEDILSDGEPSKFATVVKDSSDENKLEDEDREKINSPPRLVEGRSTVAVGKVNKSSPPSVGYVTPHDSLQRDTKTTDAKESVGVKEDGGGTFNEQDGQKLENDGTEDKPKGKTGQGKDVEGRVEIGDDNKGFRGESNGIHGDSQGIQGDSQGSHCDGKSMNKMDHPGAIGEDNLNINSSKGNLLITHDFTNLVFDSSHTEMDQGLTRPTVCLVGGKGSDNLDQDRESDLGSVSKNPCESQGIHGNSRSIKNSEDHAEAIAGVNVNSNANKGNLLITHDFTNHPHDGSHTQIGQGFARPVGDKGISNLDKDGKLKLGSESKNARLISKDFTMLEQRVVEDSRGGLKDDCTTGEQEGVQEIQERDEVKNNKVTGGGYDGDESANSQSQGTGQTLSSPKPLRSQEPEESANSQSQGTDQTLSSPKPLRSQEPEENEVSVQTTHWARSLVKGVVGSAFHNLFGNNLSSYESI